MLEEQTDLPREASPGGPLVSVIMPAFNSDAFITEAVESVIRQTLTDWELIIIDDGSDDPQALDAVLAPYRKRVRLIRQANAGVSAARNTGLRAARGRYVAFLDSDDGWEPEFLATQVGILEHDPSLTLVYCDAIMRADAPINGCRAMLRSPSSGEADLLGLVSLRCTVLTSCVVARREPVLAAGLFDTRLAVSEDFDLWLRLLLQGARFSYHTQPLGWRRVRAGSLSRDTARMAKVGAEIISSHWEEMSSSPDVQAAARVSIRKLRGAEALVRGKQALLEGNHPVAQFELARARGSLGGSKLALASWLVQRLPRLATRGYRLLARHRGE